MRILTSRYFRYGVLSVALAIAPLVRADEHPNPPSIVIGYCSGCHGIDGKSQLPYVPRLAGLDADYTQRKLAYFKSAAASPVDETFHPNIHTANGGKRAGLTPAATSHMVGVANALADKDIQAATQWYALQQPAPAKSRSGKALEEGRNLYANGLQSQGLRACQTCHGADAQGTHAVPRLAGQNAAYLVNQLALFRAGGGRGDSPMTDIARRLESDQARALAQYLQSR